MVQTNIDNQRKRSVRIVWVRPQDVQPRFTGAAEHNDTRIGRTLDPATPLLRLDKSVQNQGHHPRRPDLSANIRVLFPNEEYTGEYLSHGQSKTVFILRCQERRFDGAVLKLSLIHI